MTPEIPDILHMLHNHQRLYSFTVSQFGRSILTLNQLENILRQTSLCVIFIHPMLKYGHIQTFRHSMKYNQQVNRIENFPR